jgi:hypothetical protein
MPLHEQLAIELESMADAADAKGKIIGPALREIATAFRAAGVGESEADLRDAFARTRAMAADVDSKGPEALLGWLWG